MKIVLMLVLFFSTVGLSFAQEETYPAWVEKAIERNRSEIIRMYELTELKMAFWSPALQVSQRFNVYSVDGSKDLIPVAITTFDLQFFRFSWGFGSVRAYVQTPFSTDTKYGVLNGTFAGVGGVGGGYLFDTRKVTISGDKKTVSGTAVSFAGEGYRMWSIDNSNISLGGGGMEIRIIRNFHQFFGFNAGLNFSGGSISIKGIEDSKSFVSFGGSIGFSF